MIFFFLKFRNMKNIFDEAENNYKSNIGCKYSTEGESQSNRNQSFIYIYIFKYCII